MILFGLGVVVWFLHLGGPWPFGEAPIHSVEAYPDGSLTPIVGSCNGDPEVEHLEEAGTEVRVAVSATQYYGSGGDCLDTLEAQLEDPLATCDRRPRHRPGRDRRSTRRRVSHRRGAPPAGSARGWMTT